MKFEKDTAVSNYKWKILNFSQENYEKHMNDCLKCMICLIQLGDQLIEWKLFYGFDREGIVIELKKKSRGDFRVKFTGWIDAKKPDSFVFFNTYEEHVKTLHKKLPIYFTKLDQIFKDPANYIENGVMTVNIRIELFDGFFLEDKDCRARCRTNNKIHSEFNEIFQLGFFSDFTIVCSDKTVISAHRAILSANSPVLKAMLQSPMKESISGRMYVTDIDGQTMTDILLFMYDSYDSYGWGKDLTAILYGAEKYQIDKLKNKCVNDIIKNLNVKDVLEFYMLADFYNLNYLMQRCVMFIKANNNALSQTEDWKKLSADQLNIIHAYPYDDSYTEFCPFL